MIDTNRYNPANLGFPGKQRKQANGGRKNQPSNLMLQIEAVADNILYDAVLAHKDSMARDPETGDIHAHDLLTDFSVTVKADNL